MATVQVTLKFGDRVTISPCTDLWMRGVMYGQVVKIGRKYVHICSTGIRGYGRVFKVRPEHLELIEVKTAGWQSLP